VRNLEIGAQFPDSKNAQRNLEIAQIPKLRGTDILTRSQSAGCRGRTPRRGPRNCDLTEYLRGWHVAWGGSKENDTEVQW